MSVKSFGYLLRSWKCVLLLVSVLTEIGIFNLEQVLDFCYFTLSLWEVILKLVFVFFRTTY